MEGRSVRIRGIGDALALGIGYVPEDRLRDGLFLDQPVGRNIIAASLDRFSGKCGFLDRGAVASGIRRWIERLDIRPAFPRSPARSLSGGNAQRVVLARWLARSPRLLILNGPTVGVDVGSKEELHRMLRDFARGGVGIILISDDIGELLSLCGRILLLRRGRIAGRLDAAGLTEADLASRLAEDRA
jgi:simple sugar transport system ATP-binding protein